MAGWTRKRIDPGGAAYDSFGAASWYSNLDPLVTALRPYLSKPSLIVDYAGGTGLLVDRLVAAPSDLHSRIVVADTSPKFLRVAIQKFRRNPRVAFRLLRLSGTPGRSSPLVSALGAKLSARGADAVVCANAVHLFGDLPGTFSDWYACLRPGGLLALGSGNILASAEGRPEMTIDSTVVAARQRVRDEYQQRRFRSPQAHRNESATARSAAHDAYFRRVFPPARSLDCYLDALSKAGFVDCQYFVRPVSVRVSDWVGFLSAYEDPIVGFIGGSTKVDGRPPSYRQVAERKRLLGSAVRQLFLGQSDFNVLWTYIIATRE